ncbi:uncharacterized protein LOC143300282 [Babylonia areolata]|uniref:uncharacterized protein LOC143300282 n=1 Tax=Babylonia areolata TaxID=304850 RepID=UPI003FD64D74
MVQTAGRATLLTADHLQLTSGHCSITLRSVLHGQEDDSNNKLRLLLLGVEADCETAGYVQLFNDEQGWQFPLSGRLCGDINSLHTQYLSLTRNVMHVAINSFNATCHPISFKLLVTATTLFGQAGDFQCDNYWKVNGALRCDGYNNCGDWSDEDSFLCGHVSGAFIGLIVGSSLLTLTLLVVVMVTVCRRRRSRRLQKDHLMSSAAVYRHAGSATLAYGSIQNNHNDSDNH